MKIRHQNIPASYLVLIKDQKILLLKRQNTGYEDGKYSLIAGHVDPGENFTQALIREAYEEAGIKILLQDLKAVHVMHRKSGKEERVDVFFSVFKWQGEIKNKEPHKCSELSWFELDQIPHNTIGYIKQLIQHTKDGVFYSEYGWD